MTTYTRTFGGNTILPSDTSFSSFQLSSFVTLSWPGTAAAGPFTSSIIEAEPTSAGLSITMPSALLVGSGETVTFKNTGGYSFDVKDSGGSAIVTIGTGEAYTVYLRDNSTQAGLWSYWQAGAGSSTVDAAAISGAGLNASAGLLRVNLSTRSFSTSQAFSDADRGSMAVWTGGSGTFTMPTAASVGSGWVMYFKNAGSGTLTIASPNSETFDGASSISLSVGEGVIVSSDGTNFSYLSAGASAGSSFSYASISVPGTGDYTLSAAEYANTSLEFTGVLTGNRNIIVPATAQDYWIVNSTTGSYTLTVKTALGTGITVTQGKSATLFCDGTKVRSADNDYPSGLSTPISVANGGTGATTADNALTNLGGTTVGKQVFTAASSSAARSAISAASTGANSFTGNQSITGDLTVSGTITGTTTAFPSGTKMLFAQTAAPTGWTKDTTHDDKALRVVTGTAGFGGSTSFTSTFASRGLANGTTSSVATTGTVGNTTLTLSQIPSHDHYVISIGGGTSGGPSTTNYVDYYMNWSGNDNYRLHGTSVAADRGLSSSSGGGGSHTHSFTGSSHSHSVSGAIDMSVQYVDVIIATKD